MPDCGLLAGSQARRQGPLHATTAVVGRQRGGASLGHQSCLAVLPSSQQAVQRAAREEPLLPCCAVPCSLPLASVPALQPCPLAGVLAWSGELLCTATYVGATPCLAAPPLPGRPAPARLPAPETRSRSAVTCQDEAAAGTGAPPSQTGPRRPRRRSSGGTRLVPPATLMTTRPALPGSPEQPFHHRMNIHHTRAGTWGDVLLLVRPPPCPGAAWWPQPALPRLPCSALRPCPMGAPPCPDPRTWARQPAGLPHRAPAMQGVHLAFACRSEPSLDATLALWQLTTCEQGWATGGGIQRAAAPPLFFWPAGTLHCSGARHCRQQPSLPPSCAPTHYHQAPRSRPTSLCACCGRRSTCGGARRCCWCCA